MNRRRSLRFLTAIILVRATRTLMRLLRRKATHFPGQLAKKLCPDFLARIDKPDQIIAITGTNAKTTVANLIADMAENLNLSFAHNAYGSNIEEGIITTLLDGTSFFGKKKKPLAILEIDERFTRIIFHSLHPDYLVVTNLFRESYLRNAHGEFIFNILDDYIPETSHVLVNADDLLSQQLAVGRQATSFGIARLSDEPIENANLIRDVVLCPNCHHPLTDRFIRYHHIGRADCEHCGWHSLVPDFELTSHTTEDLTIEHQGKKEHYPFQGENILDLYNVLTAVTLFRTLGYSADEVKSALLGVAIGKSRKEVYKIGGTSIYRMLAKGKNPIAVSRVLDAVDKLPGKKQFILLVDTSVDKMSEEDNAAWIYDAELSILTDPDVRHVIVGGRRSEDIRIALLFQGVPEEKIITCRDKLDTAKYIAKTKDPETIAILYELYSAPVAKKVMEAVKNQLVYGLSERGGK